MREVPPENAKLNFKTAANDQVEDIVDSNLNLYKKIRDNDDFGRQYFESLFDAFRDWSLSKDSKEKEVRERPEIKLKVEELIAKGENKGIEFKSTIRYDTFQNKIDKRVTFAILKTLAAFLNTDGGVLLVGVADDGSILGTGLDQFESEDKYLRFFGDKVKESIGSENMSFIEGEFVPTNDRKVFRIECKPAAKPIFLKQEGREALFIRIGAQTEAIEGQALLDYVKQRF